jgi:hypothetical protein
MELEGCRIRCNEWMNVTGQTSELRWYVRGLTHSKTARDELSDRCMIDRACIKCAN